MTEIQISPKYANVKPAGNYVYIHRRASDFTEFYVGRGSKRRAWSLQRRTDNKFWANVAIKHGVIVDICQDGLSFDDSVLLEMWLIAKLSMDGVKLSNATSGGEGILGHEHSDEAKKAISLAHSKEIYSSNGEKFQSLVKAERWLRLNGYPTARSGNISSCANGRQGVAYDRAWSYEAFPDDPVLKGQKARSALGMSLALSVPVVSNVYGKFWSMTKAVSFLRSNGFPNARHGNISSVCMNNRNIAYGSHWRYGEV